MNSSRAVERDVLLTILIIAFLISAPFLFYLDHKLYPDKFVEHLPDHVLALIAILAGISAIYYERKLDKGFDSQREEIKKIVDSVHTRYIGNWPDHLSEITDLVKDTRHGEELLIFVDFLGYGHYTKRDLFREYLDELQSAKRRKVVVKILLHPEAALRINLDAQFEKERINSQAAKELAQKYQHVYQSLIKKTKLEDYSDFVTAVLYVQARFCDSLLDATTSIPAQVCSNKDAQPETVFYWVVRQGDKLRNMIFAYSRFSGVGQGYGFRTADPQLIAIFSRDFDRKWNNAAVIKAGSELVPIAWEIAQNWEKEREGKSAKPASTSA